METLALALWLHLELLESGGSTVAQELRATGQDEEADRILDLAAYCQRINDSGH
jgi:hypothetical protein